MSNIIKTRKGLTITLAGVAERTKLSIEPSEMFSLQPDDFVGVVPKVLVKEGDTVKAGDPLFCNKACPEVTFASPVSGVVKAVERGERRRVLGITINADKKQVYKEFGRHEVKSLDGAQVKAALLEAGLFGYINQLPYAISTTPTTSPKAIFISALRDMPLAADFEYELKGQEADFQAGLTALSKIAKTYLGIGASQTAPALTVAKDVTVTIFDGPCPAGNVGVQVNHVRPVNKGEVVWTVEPTTVLFIGRLFNKGHVDLRRTIAIAGSEIKTPGYIDAIVGQVLNGIINAQLKHRDGVRIIRGNVLTGVPCRCVEGKTPALYVGGHTSEITAIPEGDKADEMVGWIMPRLKDFSTSRSYFTWLLGRKRSYTLDARIKGGERHMIMSGEYDKVLPMDIYGEYLIKAIITGNIDKMEQLGIYEVAPEDFALAEFVDSSKLELQAIVRRGLDMIRKENE